MTIVIGNHVISRVCRSVLVWGLLYHTESLLRLSVVAVLLREAAGLVPARLARRAGPRCVAGALPFALHRYVYDRIPSDGRGGDAFA